MVQEKLNYLVEIHAVADPKQADLGPLGRRVIRAMRESRNVGAYDFGSGASSPDISQIPGYEIVVVRLADADLEYEQGRFAYRDMQSTERFTDEADYKVEAATVLMRNQRILAFSCAVEPDRVAGVLTALVAARDQLPREGPGVVWIRLPDNIWGLPIEQYFEALETTLGKEFIGEQNRRINAVVLFARFMHRPAVPEGQSLGYAPYLRSVEHTNPRTPIAW